MKAKNKIPLLFKLIEHMNPVLQTSDHRDIESSAYYVNATF